MSTENSKFQSPIFLKITNFKWKNQVILVSGYYEFEITIKTQSFETRIFRRYSDIEILSELLKVKHPGCLIPSLPPKSIWTNVYFSNNQKQTEERVLQLNEFFSYIRSHPILKNSSTLAFFFRDDFDQTKEQTFLKNKIEFQITKDFSFDKFEHDNEYKHFYSIYKLLKRIDVIIINIYQANEKKLKYIEELIKLNEGKEPDNKKGNSLDIFKLVASVITVFTNRMKSFHEDSFNKYFHLIQNYLEIYQRKYYFEMNNQSTVNLEKDLEEEIKRYKKDVKEKLVNIIATFFEYKKQYEKDIQYCFENKNPNVMSGISLGTNNNDNKTNYQGEYIDNIGDDF